MFKTLTDTSKAAIFTGLVLILAVAAADDQSAHRRVCSACRIRRADRGSGAAYVGGWNQAPAAWSGDRPATAPLTRRSS